jgi:hypothetical protein
VTITPVSIAGDSVPTDPDGTAQTEVPELALQVIPVTDAVSDGAPTLRLVDPRAAAKSADALANLAAVELDEETCRRLAMSCVELSGFHVTRHRASTGWLSIVECRQFVTMFTLTPSNDRLGDQLIYAADPSFAIKTLDGTGRRIGHIAVPMPESDGTYAQLVYTATKTTLLEATDRNCQAVRRANPQQDIG